MNRRIPMAVAARTVPAGVRRWCRAGASMGLVLAAGLVLGPGSAAHAAGSDPVATAQGWVATGDFNGDAVQDVLVVDRETGGFRVGYGDAGGRVTWDPSQSVGLSPVTTLTVGRFASRAVDTFMVGDPVANRLHEVQPVAGGVPVLVPRYPEEFGASMVLALESGRASPAAGDDLVVGSVRDPGMRSGLGLYSDPVGALVRMGSLELGGRRPAVARRVAVQPAASWSMAGILVAEPESAGGAGGAAFRIVDLRSGAFRTVLDVEGLTRSTGVGSGFLSGMGAPQLFFWDPLDTDGALSFRSLLEGPAGTWALGPARGFRFGESIRHAAILNRLGNSEVLIVFADGRAATYVYDGSGGLSAGMDVAAGFVGVEAVAALDADRLLLLRGAGAGVSEAFQLVQRNGAGWDVVQEGELPVPAPLRGAANVWEYRDEPFVVANPGFTGQRAIGDWTALPVVGAASQLTILAENFRGGTQGLGAGAVVNAGAVATGTRHVLANQVHPAISVFGLEQPGPRVVGMAHPLPAAGEYAESVLMRFRIEPPGASGVSVLFRFDERGDWVEYTQPVRLYRPTVVSYFTRDRSLARSAIRTARYTFRSPAGQLDADSDGVPDYVEASLGLDPGGGADSDIDGFGDLDEIVAGTLPGDAASKPSRRTAGASDTTFEARVAAVVHDGSAQRDTAARPGTLVTVRTPQGQTVGEAPVATSIASAPGDALLRGLPRSPVGRLLSVSLPANFEAVPATSAGSPLFGRELLAVQVSPPRARGTVGFEWVAGDSLAAANRWVAAARSDLGVPEASAAWALSSDTTLAALLFERCVESLLHARGVLAPGASLTLFPHRPQDVGRVAFPDRVFVALESPGPAGEAAYAPADVLRSIVAAVSMSSAAPLRALALELYRVSGRGAEVPGDLPLPADALRQFLRGGGVPAGYQGEAGVALDAVAMRRAEVVAATILAVPVGRPWVDRVFVIPAESAEAGGCTRLLDERGTPWSLLDRQHRPWPLYDAFVLPAATRIRVRGFTDGPAACGVASIVVESLAFESLPGAAPLDADADLMDDGWERRHFSSLEQAGEGDYDRDGFGNLQEYLEGTDPADAASRGAVPRVLGPPALALEPIAGGVGGLRLRIDWPEAFASRLKVEVLAAGDLGERFEPLEMAPARGADGMLGLELPVAPVTSRFFVIRLSLR